MDTQRNKQLSPEAAHSVGRVTIDSRGRNVWQWNDDQLDSTTIMLQRLDNPELALEPTRRARRLEVEKQGGEAAQTPGRPSHKPESDDSISVAIEETFKVDIGGGFDPYNSS